jgi:hypothetical protein
MIDEHNTADVSTNQAFSPPPSDDQAPFEFAAETTATGELEPDNDEDDNTAIWSAVDMVLDTDAIMASLENEASSDAVVLPEAAVTPHSPPPESQSQLAIEKTSGRPRAVANRFRKKNRKAASTSKPSTASPSQEVTEFLTTVECLREHLNRLFDNPRSPSERLALPGRCCCNCDSEIVVATPEEPCLRAEPEQRKKRARNTGDYSELSNALVEWRSKKAQSMGFIFPSFVFPDHLIDNLAKCGSSLETVDDLRQCTGQDVIKEAEKELFGFITEFVEEVQLKNRVSAASKSVKVRTQQQEAQARRRMRQRDALEEAKTIVGSWAQAGLADVPDNVREDLARARELVNKDKAQKAKRATEARNKRHAQKNMANKNTLPQHRAETSPNDSENNGKENLCPTTE